MTTQAKHIGVKNTVKALGGAMLVIGVVTSVLAAVFKLSVKEAGWVSVASLAVLTGFVLIPISICRRAGLGKVLLDCGRAPNSRLFAGIAILLTLIATAQLVEVVGQMRQGTVELEETSELAVLLLGAAGTAVESLGRLQIREHGLLLNASALSWSNIETYRWERADESSWSLMFERRGLLRPFRWGTVSIPVRHQPAFDKALRERVELPRSSVVNPEVSRP